VAKQMDEGIEPREHRGTEADSARRLDQRRPVRRAGRVRASLAPYGRAEGGRIPTPLAPQSSLRANGGRPLRTGVIRRVSVRFRLRVSVLRGDPDEMRGQHTAQSSLASAHFERTLAAATAMKLRAVIPSSSCSWEHWALEMHVGLEWQALFIVQR